MANGPLSASITFVALLLGLVAQAQVDGAEGTPPVNNCHSCAKCYLNQHLGAPQTSQSASATLPTCNFRAPNHHHRSLLGDTNRHEDGHESQVVRRRKQKRSLWLHARHAATAELTELNRATISTAIPTTTTASPTAPTVARDATHQYQLIAEKLAPRAEEIAAWSAKPNCSRCYGCDTQLIGLENATAAGYKKPHQMGWTSSQVFFADQWQPEDCLLPSAVKVWCLPMVRQDGLKVDGCDPATRSLIVRSVQKLLALDKLAGECGLTEVVSRVWTGPVQAVHPNTGYFIWWHGLWMEKAPGDSTKHLRQILAEQHQQGKPLQKMNSSQIVLAAIFDLLVSQCDRHAGNVFIQENGHIKLIDNGMALFQDTSFNGLCALNSIFLPGTHFSEVARLGTDYVQKVSRVIGPPNPVTTLDYRCHAPGGKIGTAYPASVQQCLKKLDGLNVQEIQTEYGLPSGQEALALKQRAHDMLHKGFEWTLANGWPANPTPNRYKISEPCCKLGVDASGNFTCGHPWKVATELPYGDPITGRAWKRAGTDPGSYAIGVAVWQ